MTTRVGWVQPAGGACCCILLCLPDLTLGEMARLISISILTRPRSGYSHNLNLPDPTHSPLVARALLHLVAVGHLLVDNIILLLHVGWYTVIVIIIDWLGWLVDLVVDSERTFALHSGRPSILHLILIVIIHPNCLFSVYGICRSTIVGTARRDVCGGGRVAERLTA